MRSVSSRELTYRCNTSLGHVPATFSCVCKCCGFVPATCTRFTSLLHVVSVCTAHVFVAATCRCNLSRQPDLSCLATFNCSRVQFTIERRAFEQTYNPGTEIIHQRLPIFDKTSFIKAQNTIAFFGTEGFRM